MTVKRQLHFSVTLLLGCILAKNTDCSPNISKLNAEIDSKNKSVSEGYNVDSTPNLPKWVNIQCKTSLISTG